MNRNVLRCSWWLAFLFCFASTVVHGETIFSDDFAGGKAPQWRQRNDGSTPGRFQVQNGSYILSSSGPDSIPRALVSTIPNENYFIQADVRILPLNDQVAEASLISYYNDSTHYYALSLDGVQNYWSLSKIDKTGASLLARGPALLTQEKRRIGLYINGSDIRAFLDGVLVAQVTDSRPIRPGSFGLSARGAQAEWQKVLVKGSNPQDFWYGFSVRETDSRGIAEFSNIRFKVTGNSQSPLSGAQIYRIYRDGISYFVIQDPQNLYSTRSGFLTEFQSIGKNQFQIPLTRIGSGTLETKHVYSFFQTDWLLSFLKRSARFVTQGVTVNHRVTRNVYVSTGRFLLNDDLMSAEVFGPANHQIEGNGILFGSWNETGNYSLFPSLIGKGSSAVSFANALATMIPAPENSKFNIYSLRLSSTGTTSSAYVSWVVQEDSRGVVAVQSASFPKESLSPGRTYTVPFTMVNSGEKAGPFVLYFLLSKNSSLARTEGRLKQIKFGGLEAEQTVASQTDITIPSDTAPGRYFIGTLLEATDPNLRVLNGTSTLRPISVGDFPSNGQLSITLTWEDTADLDLHVTDPYGETIYYFRPSSNSGGSLEEDVECGAQGVHSEQIQYPAGSAASGNYVISIHYFRSCNSGGPVRWNVTANADGRVQAYEGTIGSGQYLKVAEFTR